MRAADDEPFDDDTPRAQPGDLSAPRSARRRNADPLAALSRFVAEGAVEQAAEARSRLRWQQQLALESGTWLGLLCDLAETGASVVVDTNLGGRLSGTISAVGVDFVCVTARAGIVVLTTAAIVAIQRADGRSAPVGRSGAPNDLTLPEFLTTLAVDRPTVTWHLNDHNTMTGQLVGVSQGFAHLRIDGARPSTAYVPLADHTMIGLDG
jgi:hypothetical protein